MGIVVADRHGGSVITSYQAAGDPAAGTSLRPGPRSLHRNRAVSQALKTQLRIHALRELSGSSAGRHADEIPHRPRRREPPSSGHRHASRGNALARVVTWHLRWEGDAWSCPVASFPGVVATLRAAGGTLLTSDAAGEEGEAALHGPPGDQAVTMTCTECRSRLRSGSKFC
jgi:hypothetical protein